MAIRLLELVSSEEYTAVHTGRDIAPCCLRFATAVYPPY
eukprot:SAG31_NODE_3645_length_4030_cov_2.443653_5_plen_38_part_01